MEPRLYVGSRELRVAAGTLPEVAFVVQALGHQVQWDGGQQVLYVDSPLADVWIACRCPVQPGPAAAAWRHLQRRLLGAGALVIDEEAAMARAELEIRLWVDEQGPTQGALALRIWRRPWHDCRLGSQLVRYLQQATGRSVALEGRWSSRRTPVVEFGLCLPPAGHPDLVETALDGLWQGLLAWFRLRRPGGAAVQEVAWAQLELEGLVAAEERDPSAAGRRARIASAPDDDEPEGVEPTGAAPTVVAPDVAAPAVAACAVVAPAAAEPRRSALLGPFPAAAAPYSRPSYTWIWRRAPAEWIIRNGETMQVERSDGIVQEERSR